jgi:glyoxylase-like metal-dependent hydrolase (beta-lactamase superfamily II)
MIFIKNLRCSSGKHNTATAVLLPLIMAFGLSLSACSPSNENDAKASEPSSTSTEETPQESAIILTADFPYPFEKVAEKTWVMHGPLELPNPQNKGFMNNPGVIETSAGLVVIDPGSTLQVGEHVLAEIKKISDQPVVAVFNTHIHGDHWLANQAIKAAYPEVKIYGHPEMLVEIEQGEGESWVQTMDTLTEGASKGTIVVAPNSTVDNSDMIKVGDTSFKIHHYGIAHTKTDIMIEVVENNVIFLGDNVLAKRLPRMTDGTFQGSISTINTILESNIYTYVPGHGQTGEKAMVLDYLNYITLVYEAAQKTFEEDLDSSDVITITRVSTEAYQNWSGYEEQLGPQGAQAYAEVEESEF